MQHRTLEDASDFPRSNSCKTWMRLSTSNSCSVCQQILPLQCPSQRNHVQTLDWEVKGQLRLKRKWARKILLFSRVSPYAAFIPQNQRPFSRARCLRSSETLGKMLCYWITNTSPLETIWLAFQIQKFCRISCALIFNALTVTLPELIITCWD